MRALAGALMCSVAYLFEGTSTGSTTAMVLMGFTLIVADLAHDLRS
jgi:hypothetical protein